MFFLFSLVCFLSIVFQFFSMSLSQELFFFRNVLSIVFSDRILFPLFVKMFVFSDNFFLFKKFCVPVVPNFCFFSMVFGFFLQ